MKFARQFMTVARRPTIGAEYLRWLLQRHFLKREPTRQLHNLVKIGNFANFSEYHSIVGCLNDDELSFLSKHTLGDGQIIDIGANIGFVTLVLANRYRDRMVHAFEPNPFTYPTLVSNVVLNGLNNVQCHEMAITDKNGTVLFHAHPYERTTAAIAQTMEGYTTSVSCRTLDDFTRTMGIDHVSLLKVDVEGYETSVFRGGSATLREIKPSFIYFEVCPILTESRGFDPTEPARTLLEHGYTLHRLAAGGELMPARLEDIPPVILENWVAERGRRV
jgi:FkbM family methyltransferase